MFVVPIPFILPAVSLAAPDAPGGVVHQVLPSGVHLFVVERPNTKLTAIEIRVRGAGTGSETPETNGTAHAIEHLLFKGTATQQPGAFDAAFERLGGEVSAQTMRDATAFRIQTLPDKWQEAMKLFGELLMKPAFRADDWGREQTVIQKEMGVAQSDTQKLGLQILSSAAFPDGDPYRMPLMGSPENVRRFSPEDLRAFHAHWYRPSHLTVVVVGPVKADEVRQAVDAAFPAVAPTADDTDKPVIPAASVDPLETVTRAPLPADDAQTQRHLATVSLAFRAPRLSTDAVPAVLCDVLAAMLVRGGNDGIIGRRLLADKTVDVLSADAAYLPQERRSLFLISSTADKHDIGRTEDVIISALEDISARIAAGSDKDTSLDDELEVAKGVAIATERYRRDTVEGEAQYLAYLDMLNAPDDYREHYADRVRAVTIADIGHLLDRYITPSKRVVAVIGLPSAAPIAQGDATP